MVELGYTLSSEEHEPNDLIEQAVRAEEAGFDFVSISDHFHPWIGQQGNAPLAWSVLGGIAQATDEIGIGIGVTCPIMRYHPTIVAQASATIATMAPGRFTFGVGTGEKLNEHVTGEHWPEQPVRLEMLEEAVEIIRKLWTGENVSHYGKHYTVENAKLYTVPDENPPICVSAYGDRAAKSAARIGDGFWSVGPQDVVETFESQGGEGPKYTQLSACYADSEEEAVETAHENWPNSALPGELAVLLPTPKHFEQAVQMVEEQDIREGSIITDPDPETHAKNIENAVDAGYDHVYVHQIGPEQEKLVGMYEDEILPQFG